MVAATERLVVGLVTRAVVHPRGTLLVLLVVTALLGTGLGRLGFRTDLLDYLPSSHPSVQAFGRVLENIDGVTNQEMLWLELDTERARDLGVTAITDEVALRAQDALARFVRERVPEVRHVFGLPLWVHLARSGALAADDVDPELPASSAELTGIWNAVWLTQRELVEVAISEDGRAAVMGFVIDGDPMSGRARDVGQRILRAVEEARESPDGAFDLFRADLLHPVGLASGMARIDASLRADVARLAPLALLLVLAFLLLAFRSVTTVLVGMATLLMGIVWVYGLMGWLGVGLNVVNIALVPLMLGSGIDFAIHVLNEFQEERAAGASVADAFRQVASRAGMALTLTTVITVSGLLALTLSGVPGIVELGLFAAFGMLALALLVLTLPPAFLATGAGASGAVTFAPSRLMARTLGTLTRRRTLALLLIVLLSGASVVGWRQTLYQLDVIQGSFPPTDPVSRVVERMRAGVGGAFPEFLIVDGDITDPRTMEACRRLAKTARDPELGVGPDARVLGPADLLGSHEIMKDGWIAAAGRFLAVGGDLSSAVPTERAAIEASLRAMHAHPVWSPLANLVTSPELDQAVIVVFPPLAEDSLRSAGELWDTLQGIVDADPSSPVTASFLGYRTMTYLFIETSLAWMRALLVISLGIACLLVWVCVGSLRAVMGIAAIMILSSFWWFGALRLFDVYVSVFLLFPLVFIVCIGSDHALHLLWGLQRRGDRGEVYGTTGKAVLYSALTDATVFFLFATMTLVSASQVMLATGLAVSAIFVGTLLAVPVLLAGPDRAEPPER